MIGYGPEDTHFVIELTYNYGIKQYEAGNDFKAITIRSKDIIERARASGWPMCEENGKIMMQAPGGYKYYIINEQHLAGSGKYIYFFYFIMPITAKLQLKYINLCYY